MTSKGIETFWLNLVWLNLTFHFKPKPLNVNSFAIIVKTTYSWVSSDVIYFSGVNSTSRHRCQAELDVHCMCWPCFFQICAISYHLPTKVRSITILFNTIPIQINYKIYREEKMWRISRYLFWNCVNQ